VEGDGAEKGEGPIGEDGRHEIWREDIYDHDNEPRYATRTRRTDDRKIPSRRNSTFDCTGSSLSSFPSQPKIIEGTAECNCNLHRNARFCESYGGRCR
jgi:hypothetical protein